MTDDVRRRTPRTDAVLADPRLVAAAAHLGTELVKAVVVELQARVRSGELEPEALIEVVCRSLPDTACTLRPVINATGVVLHTNLGRAPLSAAARAAMTAASGYVDVELDLATGERGQRGAGVRAALLQAVPAAQDVLVVNNGAAALLLATTAFAGGRDVLVSRGEMVEIGDGFRLHELIESAGARVREVGATNRTNLADYQAALGPDTGCILKVHPSNFRIEGFTAAAGVLDLAALGAPVVVDVGSGLLQPDAQLPHEPDVGSQLAAGASIVTCSGDKLLGGPQAGLIFGQKDQVQRLRRHPLRRALRVDKITLAALEATIRGPVPPAVGYRRADPARLRARAARVASSVGGTVVASPGAVGGGGAPGQQLPGWAVALPVELAARLRVGEPPVMARVHQDQCLVDLRCVDEADDAVVVDAIRAARS